MTLKYVGPKPYISHTGIKFDNNKEDKYVYLNIVIQLLKALNHDYFEDKTYIYKTNSSRIDEEKLLHELEQFCPDLKLLINKKNHNIENEIKENINRVHENEILTQEDKQTLENNINIMHDYLVQRAINKSVYYHVINALADLVTKDHIDHIITPMYQKFVHVLHSLQGALLKRKAQVDTELEIYKEDEQLFVRLQVINKI
jgi:hypothetical protein